MVNPWNKVGACGVVSVLLPMFNPVSIIKIDSVTGTPLRDSNGLCVKAEVNEPGEIVAKIGRRGILNQFDG